VGADLQAGQQEPERQDQAGANGPENEEHLEPRASRGTKGYRDNRGGHTGTRSGAGSEQSPRMPPRHGAHGFPTGQGDPPAARLTLLPQPRHPSKELDPENNENQFKSNEI